MSNLTALQGTSPLYDAAALRKVEAQAAIALDGDAFELMRRAGQWTWRYLLQHWPQAQHIVVACGPGNNGGDGYVLARHAHESGRSVVVVRLHSHAPRAENARRASAQFADAGGRIIEAQDEALDALASADLLVDAVFGIGFSREPDPETDAWLRQLRQTNCDVLALDLPSGIDADRGSRPGTALHATRTLQFIAGHLGLLTGAAVECTGVLDIASLDVPTQAWQRVVPAAEALSHLALTQALPARDRNSHKGSHGRVLCIGGDVGMGGAIVMCAQAALRGGAGLVSIATRAAHVPALLARAPECMAHGVESAAQIQPLIERADVIALGPGLGCAPWGCELRDAALRSGKPLVLDADALDARMLRDIDLRGSVMTPHPGEAARLLGIDTVQVQADRYAAAARIADIFGSVLVLKGAGTIVAASGRMPAVIAAGNPGMAVGGMGDVLTGVVAAMRAQGMDAFDAARIGALAHAYAGDIAAREGERGMLPSDLLACLRRVVNPSSAR